MTPPKKMAPKSAAGQPTRSGKTARAQMTTKAAAPARTGITPAALEKLRLDVGLTQSDSAAIFGVPIAKWYDMLTPAKIKMPLEDVSLALLCLLFNKYPAVAPKPPPSIRHFYSWLGFTETRDDKTEFARLIGRQYPTVYRYLGSTNGNASRPTIRYIQALQELSLTPLQTRKVMEQLAKLAYTNSQGGA